MSTIRPLAILTAISVLVAPSQAHAYVDPGTGSVMTQAIIGVIVAWALPVWMIIHAARNDVNNRALWIILMVFFGIFAAIIYLFAVKLPYDRQQREKATNTSKRR